MFVNDSVPMCLLMILYNCDTQYSSELELYRISLFQFRPELHPDGFRNLNLAGARFGFGQNLFSDHRTICLDRTNGVNNAVICNKEAVQFSASLLRHCLPPVFEKICGTEMNLAFFSSR